jgi:predicted TIM-barrel fold metal-dependent hydrolase
MRIDCNASLGSWPFRRLSHSAADEFLALMDRNVVDEAWVSPFEGVLYQSAWEANDSLREALEGCGDRLKLVAALNPTYPGWEDDLAEYAGWGVRGVRLYPSYHGYEPGGPELGELLAALAEARMFAQVVARVEDERLHHPLMRVEPFDLKPLVDLAARFSGCPIIILNANNAQLAALGPGPWPGNLYTDIAHIEGLGGVGKLAQAIGAAHVLLGSQAPLLYMESAVLKLQEADLGEAEAEAIAWRNARRVMG